jgi:hypothetical protein
MGAHYRGTFRMNFGRKKDPAEQVDLEQLDRSETGEDGPGLEERLRALIDLERATRDSFEQREAEQLAARRAETDERLAAAEEALAEAQMREEQERVAQRSLAELEKNLVEAWSEVARIREELAEARRETDDARKEIRPRSERKVAEAQAALAEARAEIERERELRAELAQRLEQSEREAREALEQRVPAADVEEAERRIAELEEMLAAAQAEAERERGQRGEMERRLEVLVEHEAEAEQALERQFAESEKRREEAERTAGEASEALARVRAERDHQRRRLLAIEEQLQALVGAVEPTAPASARRPRPDPAAAEPPAALEEDEMPHGDDEGGEADERERDGVSEAVPPLLEALGTGHPRETTTPEHAGPTVNEEDEVPEPSDTAQDRSQIRRGRRHWGRKSERRSYVCAVCKRLPLGQRPKQLTGSGWVIAGETALCPDCQRFGWQLPEDGGLPFRRSSAGQTSS